MRKINLDRIKVIGALIIVFSIHSLWVGLEILMYDEIPPRGVDNIIGLLLFWSLYANFCHWLNKKQKIELSFLQDIEIGTAEKTKNSRFQVMLTDLRNKEIHPLNQLRINRFFDNEKDRDAFLNIMERSVQRVGGKLVHNDKLSHFCFESYDVCDQYDNQLYSITVYG